MEEPTYIFARDLSELNQAMSLFPRDGQCVKCDGTQQLKCPSCPAGESCQFTVQTNCQTCPQAICSSNGGGSSGSNGGSGGGGGGSNGPNPGAIAGGVIGGLIVVALVSYLVWRFFVKPRRSTEAAYSIYEPEQQAHDREKDNASRLTRRSSTHTVHSIASTVLTRASNIIQIAYIPGVTNRATPSSDSPSVLVPPVPPIPSQHVEGRRQTGQDESHYFVPGNIRDSSYSGMSGYSDRTSYARTSYAPRSSIASTIYGKQAQVAAPAQSAMRIKPTMVSVKSMGSLNSSEAGDHTPPVPSINFEKFANGRPKSGASAFSVGSTFLNNANTATQARAQVIKVGGGLKKIEIGSTKSDAGATPTDSPASSTPATPNPNSTTPEASPSVDQGPFSDPPQKSTKTVGLEAVAEDEDEHEVQPSKGLESPESVVRGSSPFGDEHATKDS